MNRFIDLFSGIGGFHVALKKHGMECVFSSDIDKAACDSYAANFGERPSGDISQIHAEVIPPHDIICAGFPCQSFSISGKRYGLNDDRGRLFFEVVRIAKYHKPLLLLLENVKQILTIDNGTVIQKIHQTLDNAGYHLEHVALNSGDFGVPQKRERVYFVAIRKDAPFRFVRPNPNPNHHHKYLKDVLVSDKKCEGMYLDRPDIIINKPIPSTPSLKPMQIGYLNKGGQGERIYSINGHAITLSANGWRGRLKNRALQNPKRHSAASYR